jgi:hypothetical protein
VYIDLLTDCIVRVFFILIQMILLLVFEYKLHLYQHRILLALILNSFMLFGSCQLNPFFTFTLIMVILGPYFKRLEKMYEKLIQEAFYNDINIESYQHKTKQE